MSGTDTETEEISEPVEDGTGNDSVDSKEDPIITVYDLDGNEIVDARRSEIAAALESGIYYFSISDSYYGTDHLEEVLELAKSIDEAYSENVTAMQDLVAEELEKDPYAFTDKYYCDHMFRVIIP